MTIKPGTHTRISSLVDAFHDVRQRTLRLVENLSDEDCTLQSMDDASPAKWHLAHTTWFWETFLLAGQTPAYKPYNAAFRQLYNSYYNGVSDQYPRGTRGLWSRPGLSEVLEYRAYVDEAVTDFLPTLVASDSGHADDLASIIELGLNHEQQHQELIVTDLHHLFFQNPLGPACYPQSQQILPARPAARPPAASAWVDIDGALVTSGYTGKTFCFDNELPAHRTYLNPFSIAADLVTCAQYADFIRQGGYDEPRWWLSEGFDWASSNKVRHPHYWKADADEWLEFTLNGYQPLQPDAPVCYLSYFEADAFARFAGARLPTEFEWEYAAALSAGAGPDGTGTLNQLDGAVWQWTNSSYAPYPGFSVAADAIGEYNGKFMVNQYVLRGGSFVTPPGHTRPTYRNFFPARARWQSSGIRLAKDSGNL